jgi:trehalose 6-phosphate synthase/phosphatase
LTRRWSTSRTPTFEVIARLTDALQLILLLDYDGTLVPLAPSPDLAVPQPRLLALLAGLATRSGTHLHLVSGRSSDDLSRWFGYLPADLWAEHGAYHRSSDGDWQPTVPVHLGWMADVHPVLGQLTAETPGSFVETKHASLAWHYRAAHPETGPRQAQALRMRLDEVLREGSAQVLEGRKVIEVRMRGVSKAIVAEHLRAEDSADRTLLAIGDDWTDEELFEALPESSITIAVGRRRSRAKYQLPDDVAVRELLETILIG